MYFAIWNGNPLFNIDRRLCGMYSSNIHE